MVSDLTAAAKHLSRTWSEFVMSRKSLSLLLAIVAALTIGLAPAFAKPALPPGVEYLPDLVFGTADGTELKLDLARPSQGAGPFPAVVCVHGGGWHMGTRKMYRSWLQELAQQGYVAVSVGYRLSPKHRFPCQINDVKCAVRWLRANADKYGVDRDRIGCLGDSAGGHLVCLLGATSKKDGLEGDGGHADQSSAVCCVVAYYPPTDLTMAHEVIRGGKAPFLEGLYAKKCLEDLLGGPPEKVGAEKYAQCSPLCYAGKHCPPTLLVHGTADRLVPIEQSKLLEKKLREAGVDVTLLPIEKGGHGFWGKDNEKAARAAMEFLTKHLKPAKAGQ
jgi:acetyl esterase/lipase